MREGELMRRIQKHASTLGARLFRNQVGFCECRGRKIRYGVCSPGGSDLIGWTSSGRFMAVEVKTARGITTKQQANFLKQVIRAGGIGIVARSEDDLKW